MDNIFAAMAHGGQFTVRLTHYQHKMPADTHKWRAEFNGISPHKKQVVHVVKYGPTAAVASRRLDDELLGIALLDSENLT